MHAGCAMLGVRMAHLFVQIIQPPPANRSSSTGSAGGTSDRAELECLLTAQLSHPNIVTTLKSAQVPVQVLAAQPTASNLIPPALVHRCTTGTVERSTGAPSDSLRGCRRRLGPKCPSTKPGWCWSTATTARCSTRSSAASLTRASSSPAAAARSRTFQPSSAPPAPSPAQLC